MRHNLFTALTLVFASLSNAQTCNFGLQANLLNCSPGATLLDSVSLGRNPTDAIASCYASCASNPSCLSFGLLTGPLNLVTLCTRFTTLYSVSNLLCNLPIALNLIIYDVLPPCALSTLPVVMETSSSVMETSSSVMETSSSVAETSSSVVETSSSVVETSSSVAETSSSFQSTTISELPSSSSTTLMPSASCVPIFTPFLNSVYSGLTSHILDTPAANLAQCQQICVNTAPCNSFAFTDLGTGTAPCQLFNTASSVDTSKITFSLGVNIYFGTGCGLELLPSCVPEFTPFPNSVYGGPTAHLSDFPATNLENCEQICLSNAPCNSFAFVATGSNFACQLYNTNYPIDPSLITASPGTDIYFAQGCGLSPLPACVHQYTEFADSTYAGTTIGLSASNVNSLQACEDTCGALLACNSFGFSSNGDGTFACSLFNTLLPIDLASLNALVGLNIYFQNNCGVTLLPSSSSSSSSSIVSSTLSSSMESSSTSDTSTITLVASSTVSSTSSATESSISSSATDSSAISSSTDSSTPSMTTSSLTSSISSDTDPSTSSIVSFTSSTTSSTSSTSSSSVPPGPACVLNCRRRGTLRLLINGSCPRDQGKCFGNGFVIDCSRGIPVPVPCQLSSPSSIMPSSSSSFSTISTSTRSSSSVSPSPSVIISPNFTCGPKHRGYVCPSGYCCSQ
jgi:hypothetical protein